MDCVIDDDLSDCDGLAFLKERRVKAKIQHRCTECRKRILPGQVYENVFGVWDGNARTFKTCAVCLELRDKIFCGCYYYGDILDRITREIRDNDLPLCAIDGLSAEAIAVLSDLIWDAALSSYGE